MLECSSRDVQTSRTRRHLLQVSWPASFDNVFPCARVHDSSPTCLPADQLRPTLRRRSADLCSLPRPQRQHRHQLRPALVCDGRRQWLFCPVGGHERPAERLGRLWLPCLRHLRHAWRLGRHSEAGRQQPHRHSLVLSVPLACLACPARVSALCRHCCACHALHMSTKQPLTPCSASHGRPTTVARMRAHNTRLPVCRCLCEQLLLGRL